MFSFFLADLQWRHLSANKSTLWWHSGLSRPGEDSTLLCNISLLSSFLVIQTVGNWKTEGWHHIEVQQNQTKSPMRVLFVNSLNKSKAMVRVFRVLFRVENMVWSCLACARKLARKILILNILDFLGPFDDLYGIYALIYVRNVRCHTCTHTHMRKVESKAVFCLCRKWNCNFVILFAGRWIGLQLGGFPKHQSIQVQQVFFYSNCCPSVIWIANYAIC